MRTKQVPGTYFSRKSWEPSSGMPYLITAVFVCVAESRFLNFYNCFLVLILCFFGVFELYLQIEWKPCDYAAEDQSKSRNLECQQSIIFSLCSGDWSEEIFVAPPNSYLRTLPVKEAFLQFNLLWLCWRPQPAKWNCFSQFLAIAETVYFSWVDTRCESLKPEGWHRLWFNRRGKSWNITITEIRKSIMNLWAAYQFNHELLDFLSRWKKDNG